MDYKEALRQHFDNETPTIDFSTLIEGVITLYGHDKNVYMAGSSVTVSSSGMHLSEEKINDILNELLTVDGTNMAYFIVNTPEAHDVLQWAYNIQAGECSISKRTHN